MAAKRFLSEKWLYVLLLVLALALPILITNRYVFQIVIMGCLFSICTLSLNLILGYTGQASLAHAGFFGIGAYGVALLTKHGLSFLAGAPSFGASRGLGRVFDRAAHTSDQRVLLCHLHIMLRRHSLYRRG